MGDFHHGLIGGLDLVRDHVRQLRLDDLPRVVRLLGYSGPERRAEAARHGLDRRVLAAVLPPPRRAARKRDLLARQQTIRALRVHLAERLAEE